MYPWLNRHPEALDLHILSDTLKKTSGLKNLHFIDRFRLYNHVIHETALGQTAEAVLWSQVSAATETEPQRQTREGPSVQSQLLPRGSGGELEGRQVQGGECPWEDREVLPAVEKGEEGRRCGSTPAVLEWNGKTRQAQERAKEEEKEKEEESSAATTTSASIADRAAVITNRAAVVASVGVTSTDRAVVDTIHSALGLDCIVKGNAGSDGR